MFPNFKYDPGHERTVSVAVERALVTLLIVTAVLCVGFLYARYMVTDANRLGVMIRVVVH